MILKTKDTSDYYNLLLVQGLNLLSPYNILSTKNEGFH